MVGVWFMGTFLDFPFKTKYLTRPTRARLAIIFLLISTFVIWGSGWIFAKTSQRGKSPVPLIDVAQSQRYLPYGVIYIAYAFYDGCFQCYVNWLLGSLSNNSATLSHYAGWYRSIQAAAAAVVWRLDGLGISYRSMFISTFAILLSSIISTLYVAFVKVKKHSTDEVSSNLDSKLVDRT